MRLEAKNISFQYNTDGRKILNNISFHLDSTERLGLMAPSGFKGYCPVQMIWQHPELSVNPRLKMKEVLKEGKHIKQRVIDGLGIQPDWMKRYPGELSGGELQRFCIARVLGEGTRFLVADEISAMLDLITQSQIWGFLLEEVKRRQIGLLAVSHSRDLLEQICSRIVRL